MEVESLIIGKGTEVFPSKIEGNLLSGSIPIKRITHLRTLANGIALGNYQFWHVILLIISWSLLPCLWKSGMYILYFHYDFETSSSLVIVIWILWAHHLIFWYVWCNLSAFHCLRHLSSKFNPVVQQCSSAQGTCMFAKRTLCIKWYNTYMYRFTMSYIYDLCHLQVIFQKKWNFLKSAYLQNKSWS